MTSVADTALAFPLACTIFGVLLIAMTMGGSSIARLPMTAAMLYMAVGVAAGPIGLGILVLDAIGDAKLLERLSEVAVLISLFTAGLKLRLPLRDRRWRIPLRLASVSMLVTLAAVTALGVYGLGLSLGAAVLLGAILSPTDPVLASEVQVADPTDRDRLRFGLTGEGGLNDGTAFPFVMLGLGLLSLHPLGAYGWRWAAVDVVWATSAGLGIGWAMGALIGRAIIYLRTRHKEALGANEFIVFGLIFLTYGVALLAHAYGFLAVFAAGLALQRIDDVVDRPPEELIPGTPAPTLAHEVAEAASVDAAPAHLMREVQRFNSQLERLVEVLVVLAIGALLSTVRFRVEVLWFVPTLLLIVRPVAVSLGVVGTKVTPRQRLLMGWFGIRGIGSIYYLMYAIDQGIEAPLAETLVSISVAVVVASIIAHGISVTPLMRGYQRRKDAALRQARATQD